MTQYTVQMLGSEQQLIMVGSAPMGTPCPMLRRHFTNRVMKEGDQVTLMIEVNGPGGMYTEVSRTFVLGKASDELLEAYELANYKREDFTKSGKIYDFILDVVSKSSFSDSIRSLKQDGRYLIANPGISQVVRGRWTSMTSRKKVIFGAAHLKSRDLVFLKELVEAGELKTVIDRCYSLEKTAEAHRYVEQGDKKGNVVITVEHNSRS